MSMTKEEALRRIEQAGGVEAILSSEDTAPRRPTTEDILARIERAGGVEAVLRAGGAPGEQPLAPAAQNPTLEQVGASFARPLLRTIRGIQELNRPHTLLPEQMEAVARTTQEALDWAEANRAPGAAGTGAEIMGEVALGAFPASRAYRAAQAATAGMSRLPRTLAPATAETTAVGGMEALKLPEEGQTRTQAGLTAAAGQVAGLGLQRALSSAVKPRMFERTPLAQAEMQMLEEAGIEPRLPLALGTEAQGLTSNYLRWMHRQPLRATPGFRQTLNKQIEDAQKDWREVMIRKAMPEGADIKMPKQRTSEAPVDDTMMAIDEEFSKQYKEVLEPYSFEIMGETGPVAGRVSAVLDNIPGEGSRNTVQQKFADLTGKYLEEGQLPGKNVSDFKKALRREAKVAQDGVVQSTYYDIIDALSEGVEEVIESINPEHAARYAGLGSAYRNFVVVDRAAGKAKFGEFNPEQLWQASQQWATKRGVSPMQAPYRAEAQRASAVYDIDPKAKDTNIFQLLALGGATLGGGMFAPGVTTAAWAPVLASMPRGMQKWMMGERAGQQALADLLRQPAIQEASRALRLGGGQYLAE